MKITFKIMIIAASSLLLNSCKKYEGEGGKGSVSGKITIDEKLYVSSNYSETISYDGAEEDVYIVYGTDDLIQDDKVSCNYDGTFTFKYLQPGTYTIYAYNRIFHKGSNVMSNDDDYYTKEVAKTTVELKKKEDLNIGTITLIK
jgi:hypothetical protein